MKYSSILSATILLFFAASCSSTKSTISETEKAPPPTSETTTEITKATNDWYFKTPVTSSYYGTSVEKAYNEFLKDKSPKRDVIVAIIDSGTDIDHEDLSANVWVNDDEVAGNNIDDDQNGYVDDVHGWNFIGGPDGRHVNKDTYELTRIYARLSEKYEGTEETAVPDSVKDEFDFYQQIKAKFDNRVRNNTQNIQQVNQIMQAITFAKNELNVANIDSVKMDELTPEETDTPQQQQAKQILTALRSNGNTEADVEGTKEYIEYLEGLRDYALNPDFDPRGIVGDDYDDLSDRSYGNNDVEGPSSDHGTHVAGIIGAVRDNAIGTEGIAAHVKLMIIRTVPDGDERDKDVANAIRYAAENGANVINMSFGKGYSPHKDYVDDAIRFADSKGVLLVSGSGNDGSNVDSTDSYPSKYYADGGTAANYLTVGASSWESDSTLAASFSNYGKEKVDLFAPGVQIYSTYPENNYKMEDGTSMASPVVAGVAALIMTYYPELTTPEVKEIILASVTKIDRMVYKPGSEALINFSELSASGGIVNAYQALKMAEEKVNNR